MEAATSDVGELRARILQLEAENSLLKGQLSGSEAEAQLSGAVQTSQGSLLARRRAGAGGWPPR